MAACQLAAVLLKSRLLPLEWVLANKPRFSTCIAGADFVIKMIVNEVCQGRRRIQRGECMSCSVSRVSTENYGDGDGGTKAGRPLFSISMLPVLHPLFPQKYILAAQKGAGRCQMTSNTDLHINIFAAAHCTLERKGRRLMQEAVWLLVRT